jgi:hypothetical protein
MKRVLRPLAAIAVAVVLAMPVAASLAAEPDVTTAGPTHLRPALAGHRSASGTLEAAAHRRLAARYRRLAAQAGRPLSDAQRQRVHDWSLERLRREIAALGRESAASAPTANGTLQAIAACESGGDPHAVGGGGAFRGKYQFDYGTWASVGGTGDPAAAPEAEQDRRAALLLQRSGTSPWPVCG